MYNPKSFSDMEESNMFYSVLSCGHNHVSKLWLFQTHKQARQAIADMQAKNPRLKRVCSIGYQFEGTFEEFVETTKAECEAGNAKAGKPKWVIQNY